MADEQTSVVEADQYRFHIFGGPGTTPTRQQEPVVRIQKSGELHITDSAMDLIGSPQWVELLYDPENNAIGIRPTDAQNPRAFPRRSDKRRPHVSIFAGRAFTLTHGIDTSATRRYPVKLVGDQILVLDLNAGQTSARPPSTKTSRGGPGEARQPSLATGNIEAR